MIGGASVTRALFTMIAIASLLSACKKQLGPREAAQHFFELLAAGRVPEAYDSATFAFRAQQSAELFEQAVKELGLNRVASWVLGEPELSDDTAKFSVEFVRKDGTKFPLNATFTRESKAWRVFALKSPRSVETGLVENRFSVVGKGPAFVDPVKRQPLPDEETVKKLALGTILMFNAAVAGKSFEDFHAKISEAWRKQVSVGQLERAFGVFIDKQVNISGVKDVPVTLSVPPEITTDGLLLVVGEYPTQPLRVAFALKFMYETPRWRLFGIDVSLRK